MTHRVILSTLLAFSAVFLSACAPKQINPPLFTYDTPRLTLLSAQAHARDVVGRLYTVADTHSMEPLLRGGDLIVVAPAPYAGLQLGQVITYQAGWLPASAPPVTHRLALRDDGGWILSGDNNARSEPGWRVTEENYLGLVVGHYRTKV